MTFHLFLEIFFEILQCHFSCQAQYLVRLDRDTCCSAHWKWGFICDEDQACESFCVAGAVFGEVGSWYLLLRALEMRFHMWRRSSMRVILCGRRSTWWSSSVTFRGRCSTWWRSSVSFCGRRSIWWRFECKIGRETLYFTIESASGDLEKQADLRGGLRFAFSWSDHGRIMVGSWSDRSRIVPALEMTFHLFSANFCHTLSGHFAWQAQYLVRLDSDTCCSAHCKWRFICDDDQACESFCVAGAVFGEVGWWHLLLRAL